MIRLVVALLFLALPSLFAVENPDDNGPLISITSPDSGVTYAYATTKSHALVWDKKNKVLLAVVTFQDTHEDDQLQASDDTHRFRLPGITYNEATKLFIATSAKGEQVPVAKMGKELFFPTIQVLPNAIIRVVRDHTDVTVTLDATRPTDPAVHAPPPTNPDGTHSVDLQQIL